VDTELAQVTPGREAAAAAPEDLPSPIPVKLPKNRTDKHAKVACRLQKAGKTEGKRKVKSKLQGSMMFGSQPPPTCHFQ